MSDYALVTIKPLKYKGRKYAAGELLDPTPDATLARQLLDGRFARVADTPADQRPPGSGRGGSRPRKARAVPDPIA